MFITPAYAQAAESTLGLGSFVPLILIFVVFWFLLIRPAQKKAKNHQLMVSNLKKGDKVITGGGIYGKVTKVIVAESEFMNTFIDDSPGRRIEASRDGSIRKNYPRTQCCIAFSLHI